MYLFSEFMIHSLYIDTPQREIYIFNTRFINVNITCLKEEIYKYLIYNNY